MNVGDDMVLLKSKLLLKKCSLDASVQTYKCWSSGFEERVQNCSRSPVLIEIPDKNTENCTGK